MVRKLASLFTLFTLLTAPATEAQLPPIADDAIVSQVSPTTIMVRDLEESLKLYRDILGFKPRWDSMLEGPFWNEVVGTPGENKRIKVLIMETAAGGGIGNIVLFQYVDENDGPPVYKAPPLQTGDVALILMTNDIHGIYAAVKGAGYTIISPPMTQDPEPGADSGYEMLFFDRDGIVVNLIQVGGR